MVFTKLNLKKMFGFLFILGSAFALTACGPNEEAIALEEATALLEEAKTSLYIPDATNIVNNIDFGTTGRNGVTIAWSTDKPEYVSNAGVVVRPSFEVGDQTVTVTATMTLQYSVGDKGESTTKSITDTKVFTIRVRALSEAASTVQTVAQARAAAMDSDVTVEAVVFSKFNDTNFGFFVADETGGIFVYARHTDYALGDKLRVTAKRQAYYGAPQLAGTVGVVKISSGNPLPTPVVKTVDEIAIEPAVSAAIQGDLNLVEAKLVQKTEGVNKNYYLQDPFTGKEIQIYYRTYTANTATDTTLDPLFPFIDKYVRIRIAVYYYDNRIPMWSVDYTVTPGSIEEISAPVLSDAQKAAIVKNLIEAEYDGTKRIAGTTLTLPSANTDFGATISWLATGDNAGYVNVTTGALSNVSENKVVTLVASITVGTQTVQAEIDITIEPVALRTINSVKGVDNGTFVMVEGTVTNVVGRNVYIQDASGGIVVYFNLSGTDLATAVQGLIPGVDVRIVGSKNTFNGLFQIEKTVTVEILTTNTPYTPVTLTALDATTLLPHQAKNVNIYGLKIKEAFLVSSAGYNVVLTNGTDDIILRVDSRLVNLAAINTKMGTLAVGDDVDILGATIGWFNVPQVALGHPDQIVKVEMTDAQKLEAIEDELIAALDGKEYGSGATVVLPATSVRFGGTISWAASGVNAGLINVSTGLLETVTEQQEITLVATITLGTETPVEVTVTIKVNEGEPETFATDLFISYYVEGTSNNKILVIHNNTGATVQLTGYFAGSFNNTGVVANGITDASDITKALGVALTGSLAHGKSIILYNDALNDAAMVAMLAEATTNGHTVVPISYSPPRAIAFNGNGGDVVVLMKEEVLIDVIGLFGENLAGSSTPASWETTYTLNKTLIRKADQMGPNAVNDWDQWEVNAENFIDSRLYSWKNN